MDRALCPPDGDSAKGEEKEEENSRFFFSPEENRKCKTNRIDLLVICGSIYSSLSEGALSLILVRLFQGESFGGHVLTLSYSEGFPFLAVFRHHKLKIVLIKLTIPGFPYNLPFVSCGDKGFQKNCIGQVYPPEYQA
jgi:hypothetical protein